MLLQPGDKLGKYRIASLLGEGGMGEVYLAEHPFLKTTVALKVMAPEISKDRGFIDRFQREAAVMHGLRHPHIVQVHDMDHDEARGIYYLAMDYIVGPLGTPLSLQQHLDGQPSGRVPGEQALAWSLQVAQALAHAHDGKVVHRDLKPANLLVDAKLNLRLTDFGLAFAVGEELIKSRIEASRIEASRLERSLGGARTIVPAGGHTDGASTSRDREGATSGARSRGIRMLTRGSSGTPALSLAGTRAAGSSRRGSEIVGTYDYMSPEQRGEIQGVAVGPASDIYAFGVLLYRMLTGHRPVGMAEAPSELVPGLSTGWDDLVRQCMRRLPDQRPADGGALAALLGRMGTGVAAKAMIDPAGPIRPNAEAEERFRAAAREALADGVLTEAEKQGLLALAQTLHLPQARMKQLFDEEKAARERAATPPVTTPPFPASRDRQGATPPIIELDLGHGISLPFVRIPAGAFLMGGDEPADTVARKAGLGADGVKYFTGEHPQYKQRIAQPFHLGVTAVTQAQYQAVTGGNPSHFKGDGKLPVESVSWHDAVAFCAKLNAMDTVKAKGMRVRLPTEAEWEYACRAGTTTPFHFGETISTAQANYDGNYTYGSWNKGTYREKTIAVGSLNKPNAWGLHDMHGNVYEWCSSRHKDYPYKSDDGRENMSATSSRVLRGGSWNDYPGLCRSAYRVNVTPDGRSDDFGFRLALDLNGWA